MIVFLRNIPNGTTRKDIANFLMPALKGGLFRATGKILSIDFLVIQDTETQITEYHGLVSILPDSAARRVIKKLHGQPLKNQRIALREYVMRSWQNDRRSMAKLAAHDPGDRRIGVSRRRGYLKVQKLKSISG